MFDDQHHPQWSFVRNWNIRKCRCERCTEPQAAPYPSGPNAAGQMIPYAPPYAQKQPFYSPDTAGSVPLGHWQTIVSAKTNAH